MEGGYGGLCVNQAPGPSVLEEEGGVGLVPRSAVEALLATRTERDASREHRELLKQEGVRGGSNG
jgi:hypothetical protein